MFLVVIIAISAISLLRSEFGFTLWFIVFAPIVLWYAAFVPLMVICAGRMHSAPVVPVSRGWLVTLLVPLGAIVVTIIVIVIILSVMVVVTWSSLT